MPGGEAKHIFYVANGIILCTCYVFVFCLRGLVAEDGEWRAVDGRMGTTRTAFKIALSGRNRNDDDLDFLQFDKVLKQKCNQTFSPQH